MRNYEVTFVVDPTLSRDEIRSTARAYVDHLKSEGCTIVHVEEMGLRQLAYPINRRSTGEYFCVEFEAPNGEVIAPMELQMRRNEKIMRFLTVTLDKYGVKYNADKRAGKIGKVKKKAPKADAKKDSRHSKPKRKPRPPRPERTPREKEPVNAPEGEPKVRQEPKKPAATAPELRPNPGSNEEE